MESLAVSALLLFALLAPVRGVLASDAFCGGAILSIGDSHAELLLKCGEPDWKESRREDVSERVDGRTVRTSIVTVEEWTYNLGPQQFIRIVTLRNGKIADIRLGSYGSVKERDRDAGPSRCADAVISLGMSTGEVLAKCGSPSWKDARTEELIRRDESGNEFRTIVTIDEWTYNPGPGRFLRIFTFRDGVLADTRTGGYGTDERKEGRP